MKKAERHLVHTHKLDHVGRVLIPKQIRTQAGLHAHDRIEFISAPNAIGIKLHQASCIFCSAADDLIQFENIHYCSQCHEKLIQKLKETNII